MNAIKNAFRNINILYLSMLAGQLLLFAVIYFFLAGGEITEETPLKYIGGGLSIATIFGGFALYNMRKAAGAKLKGLEEKLAQYRTDFILRAAMIEGGNLINVVFYFITNNVIFLLFFGLGILVFAFLIRPNPLTFASDYQISGKEKSELDSALR